MGWLTSKVELFKYKWVQGNCRHVCLLCRHKKHCLIECFIELGIIEVEI